MGAGLCGQLNYRRAQVLIFLYYSSNNANKIMI